MSQFIFPPLTASLDSEASDGASSLPSKVMVVGGWDGSNVQAIKTDAAGDLQIDVGSITPGTGATDLGKAIQSAQGATDTGVAALVVRNDTLADLAGSDHDYAPLQVNASGALYIVQSAALPAGTNAIGKLAANSGVDIGDVDVTSLPSIPAGTNSIGTVILGAGTAAIGKLSANSGVDIGDVDVTSLPSIPSGSNNIGSVGLESGTNAIGKLVANSGVDIGDVDVTSVIPGTGATNLGKAIQSAQGTTDTGVPALVVRNDTLADLSGADGDYAPIQVNASGAVYTVLSAGTASIGTVVLGAGTAEIGKLAAGTAAIGKLAANSGVDIGDVDVTSLPALAAGSNTIGKVDVNAIAPVDFLDDGVMDTSTDNIASTGTIVVASTLAAACTEIEIQEDIGEFMSMRVGGTVKAYLPLGGGRVKCHLSTGDAVTLFSETGTTINSGKIAMNFLA